jgi:hypothetical protein
MAVFGPYTQPVKPAEWVDPLDLNLYAKGTMYKQQLAEQNLQNLTEKFASAFNVPAYGIDAQELGLIENDFKEKLKSLNLSNLSDMSTVSQMRGLINQYTSPTTAEGKKMLSIGSRGYKFKDWEEKIKKYEEKGLQVPVWNLKAYQDAQNYYAGNEFQENKSFTGDVKAGFDWDKHNKSLVAGVPEMEQLKKAGPNNEIYKGKTYNALYGKFYEGLNQPGALDDLRSQFEYNYGNEDYSQLDKKLAKQQMQKLNYIIQTTDNPLILQQAKQDLDYWDDFANSVNPTTSKEDAFKHYVQINAEDFARTNTNYALKDSKMSDANKLYTEHIYRKEEIKAREESAIQKIQETQKLKALAGNVLDPLQRKLIEKGINSGYSTELLNEDGTFKSSQELVALGLKVEDEKQDEKPDDTKLQIGEEKYTKEEIIANINAGSKAFIKDYIDAFLTEGNEKVEEIEIKGDDILYDTDAFFKRPDKYFGFDKTIKKADLLKILEDKSVGTNYVGIDENGNPIFE